MLLTKTVFLSQRLVEKGCRDRRPFTDDWGYYKKMTEIRLVALIHKNFQSVFQYNFTYLFLVFISNHITFVTLCHVDATNLFFHKTWQDMLH